MAAISMQTVAKRFGKTEVIRQVNLAINDGEFAVFVGPSGCGKSTLLRLIAGLEDVSAGSIQFDQQDVTALEPSERGVAMVFQSYALYPHMSVYDNMAFGLKLKKTDSTTIQQRVQESARILQIEHLLQRKPKALSGGQRQRVAIGRAIVRKPRVFLFDEPLSNLDAALRVQMRLELKRLHRELGTTMIYVTHDQVEAMTLADRIVVLNGGKVEQVGTPLELYHHPANLFVAGFIGSPKMNFIAGKVVASNGKQVQVDIGAGNPIPVEVGEASALGSGAPVTLGVRPEHLSVTRASANGNNEPPANVEGTVVAVEHLGSEAYVHLNLKTDAPVEPLVFRANGDVVWETGQPVVLKMEPHKCYLFDDSGAAVARGH
ncbi:ABC transporter ATP-binding protein [Ketobacter sp.]|uniref:ABC transporter ATP-binding protein n=1 Tax=Ketobacter sp. TaxID=2083498 RepID=UPI000F2007D7|nr:sn-glycerol-3-phosphate ABC transporter ATP-binding protein UgpC [Ketobacter sp.]RLT95973.1 MAG: sn-glycerol-3-phosphate ABC transporter ATP-binding protein UgpC [Ketobacter sp.]